MIIRLATLAFACLITLQSTARGEPVHSQVGAAKVDTTPPAKAAALSQPIRVETGLVQGSAVTAAGVQVFEGIPYAAPPSGELRWRPPAPAHTWTGVLHADHFAADCPTSMPLPKSTASSQSEDCLYLNLWTPAQKPSAKLPVMVGFTAAEFKAHQQAIAAMTAQRWPAKASFSSASIIATAFWGS